MLSLIDRVSNDDYIFFFKTKSRKRRGEIVRKRQEGRNQETDDRPATTVRWPAVTIIIFENERRD